MMTLEAFFTVFVRTRPILFTATFVTSQFSDQVSSFGYTPKYTKIDHYREKLQNSINNYKVWRPIGKFIHRHIFYSFHVFLNSLYSSSDSLSLPVWAHSNTRTELRMPRTVLAFGKIVFLQFFFDGIETIVIFSIWILNYKYISLPVI